MQISYCPKTKDVANYISFPYQQCVYATCTEKASEVSSWCRYKSMVDSSSVWKEACHWEVIDVQITTKYRALPKPFMFSQKEQLNKILLVLFFSKALLFVHSMAFSESRQNNRTPKFT